MNEVFEKLKQYHLLIFGTGFVAEMFYRALVANKLEKQIQAFVVSEVKEMSFHGVPVKKWDGSVPEQTLLCLAVHPALLGDFPFMKTENILQVYPILYDLLYGKPIASHELKAISELLNMQNKAEHWLAARMIGIEGIRKDDPEKQQLYQKLMSCHCSSHTAKRRFEDLKKLISSIEKNGITEDVLLDEDGRIIDGLHRIAVSVELGIDQVPCTVYKKSTLYDELLTEKNRLTTEYLKERFTDREISILDETQKRIYGPVVSVIIPVYNVEKYIDHCLESVVGQSWKKLDILLINDGSEDHSLSRCLRWKERDRRIRVFNQENKGVSCARNTGIEEARGEYLAFVDPDDWLDATYIEKLVIRAMESGCNYVECDLWRYDNRTGKKIYRACYGRMGIPYSFEEHLKYAPTASYKAISQRALWIDNNIRFPECSFESPAVYALIVAVSGRIENVREALYYYRRFRENSLIETGYATRDGRPNNQMGLDAMKELLQGFRRCGLEETYREILPGIVIYRLNDILAMQFHRKAEKDFSEMTECFRTFLTDAFPNRSQPRYLTWGGYNLNRIMSHVEFLHDPACRFNFSSFASLVGNLKESDTEDKIAHKNKYRQKMLEREKNQSFWTILEQQNPELIIIDLLEERFDLLETEGRFLTLSDALESAESPIPEGHRLAWWERACIEIKKQAMFTVIDRLANDYPGLRYILVENYLCETVGNANNQELFDNHEEIRLINVMLKELYIWMKQLLPHAVIISPADDELYFTDSRYEYGAIPSHLNEIENEQIAMNIVKQLSQGKEHE